MLLRKILILIFIFCFNVMGVNAIENVGIEEGKIFTLEDCIQLALKNSPNVRKYENYLKKAKSDIGIAKSDYFPQFGLGTGFSASRNMYNKGIPASSSQLYNASVSLNQLIYNFGKTNAKIRMYKFNKIAAQFDLDNVVLQTIFDVRQNYYGVLAAEALLKINESYVQTNERLYYRTKAYFDEGIRAKIDLVNAEMSLSNAKIDLISAQNAYENALIKLNNSMFVAYAPDYYIQPTETFNFKTANSNTSLINIANDKKLYELPKYDVNAVYTSTVEKNEIIENYEIQPYPHTLEEAIELAKTNRPDLKSFEAVLSAMKEALLYTKREYFPELTAGGSWGLRSTHAYIDNGFTVGASLDFPLINGMRTKHNIDSAKADIDLAINSIDLTSQNIYFEVQKAYVNMKQLERKIPLVQTKVKQAKEEFELADARYEVGLSDFIELQDTKINYNNSQHSYVQAIYDYNVARAQLDLAIARTFETTKSEEAPEKQEKSETTETPSEEE